MFIAYLVVLRFIHVAASVCWAGGAFVNFLFVEPTAKALAPAGVQFVQHMVVKRRFNIFMVVSSTLTVLSGALLLFYRLSPGQGGQGLAWLQTGPGLAFTLGSVAGVAVYAVGMLGIKPRIDRIAKLGAEIETAGGPPTPDQGEEMVKLDRELSTLGLVDFVLVALSLTLMATARFWIF